MRSYPVGLDVWYLVWPFFYFHTSCARTAKALARRDKYHNIMSWLILYNVYVLEQRKFWPDWRDTQYYIINANLAKKCPTDTYIDRIGSENMSTSSPPFFMGDHNFAKIYSSSRINAHLMFPIFPENHPETFSGKKLFYFIFYPSN